MLRWDDAGAIGLLPEQYFRPQAKGYQLPPEQRLMAAVLEDAIDIYRKGRLRTGRKGRKLFRETKAWFDSDDITWPYSFRNVCLALGLDRTAVRNALDRSPMPARLAA